jgi:hypothetical protein
VTLAIQYVTYSNTEYLHRVHHQAFRTEGKVLETTIASFIRVNKWGGTYYAVCISSGKSSSILRIALAENFPDDEAVENEVTALFRQQPKEIYAADFQGLAKQWDKCVNVQGGYVWEIKAFFKSVILFVQVLYPFVTCRRKR